MVWVGGTLKTTKFQPPSYGQGHLLLEKAAQNPIQPGLVMNLFFFCIFAWSSGAQLALNVRAVQKYSDLIKHMLDFQNTVLNSGLIIIQPDRAP